MLKGIILNNRFVVGLRMRLGKNVTKLGRRIKGRSLSAAKLKSDAKVGVQKNVSTTLFDPKIMGILISKNRRDLVDRDDYEQLLSVATRLASQGTGRYRGVLEFESWKKSKEGLNFSKEQRQAISDMLIELGDFYERP